MKRRRLYPILLMMASTFASSAFSQESEMIEQHTHVHGHWRMFAAVDGERLTLSVSGPAVDVLGFEHEPETEAEREAVRTLSETLGAQETVTLTPAAKCKPAAAPEITLPEGFAASEDAHDIAHSAHHETAAEAHDDEHDEHHHGAEIEAVYVFSCRTPSKLNRIEHRLFDLYPSVEEIEAVFLTSSKQGVQALTRSSPDLRLR